jgi:hypothetical protein
MSKEFSYLWKSNGNNSRRQQTMNAAFSSTSTKIIKLDGERENFVLEENIISIVLLTVDDRLHKTGIEIYVNINNRKFSIKMESRNFTIG